MRNLPFPSSTLSLGAAGLLLLSGCALPPPKDFDPAAFPGPKGTLLVSTDYPGVLVVTMEKTGERYRLRGGKEGFPAPAGRLRVDEVKFLARDGKGRRWIVAADLLEQKRAPSVDLPPGGSKRLNLGFPLTGKVVAYRKGAHYYTFDPRLLGRGGESYYLDCLDERLGFPGYRIFTASGKILKEDLFTYG